MIQNKTDRWIAKNTLFTSNGLNHRLWYESFLRIDAMHQKPIIHFKWQMFYFSCHAIYCSIDIPLFLVIQSQQICLCLCARLFVNWNLKNRKEILYSAFDSCFETESKERKKSETWGSIQSHSIPEEHKHMHTHTHTQPRQENSNRILIEICVSVCEINSATSEIK